MNDAHDHGNEDLEGEKVAEEPEAWEYGFVVHWGCTFLLILSVYNVNTERPCDFTTWRYLFGVQLFGASWLF
jgi:hypothetical protein